MNVCAFEYSTFMLYKWLNTYTASQLASSLFHKQPVIFVPQKSNWTIYYHIMSVSCTNQRAWLLALATVYDRVAIVLLYINCMSIAPLPLLYYHTITVTIICEHFLFLWNAIWTSY